MKTCYYCAEEIQEKARICRYCGRNQRGDLRRTLITTAVAATVLLFLLTIVATVATTVVDSRIDRAISEELDVALFEMRETAARIAEDVATASGERIWQQTVRSLAEGTRTGAVNMTSEPGPQSIISMKLGEPVSVDLQIGQEQRLQFEVTSEGLYRIQATAGNSDNFDSYISLYDGARMLIRSDDDGGDGFNSRMDVRLSRGVYYLDVEELLGREGKCLVRVDSLPSPS